MTRTRPHNPVATPARLHGGAGPHPDQRKEASRLACRAPYGWDEEEDIDEFCGTTPTQEELDSWRAEATKLLQEELNLNLTRHGVELHTWIERTLRLITALRE